MKIYRLLQNVSVTAVALAGFVGSTAAYAREADAAVADAAVSDSATSDAAPVDSATIIVTARRKALADAIAIKKNADTIVDSVTADEAGKLPDNSITEVLQRVSGVSISRFTGANGGNTAFQIEGSGITVRGLPFNSSTLNGRQLFSANGASSISWNEVTPELMSGVDVYKATRANLIEGGASSIDLRTHVPFDFKDTQFNVSVGGSYGTQVKKASPRISAMFSKRFDTGIGEIGILWDLAYSRLHQQSSDLAVGAMFGEYAPTSVRPDNLAFIPSSFNWSNNESKRDRYGAYQAIQWKPTSNLTLTNTVFFSQYREDSRGNSGGVGRGPSGSNAVMPKVGQPVQYDPDGGFQRGTLVIGSSGKSVDWGNTTASDSFVAGNGWFPAQYRIDCGATYGTPASSLQWDWSVDGNAPMLPGGPRLVKCGGAEVLNPGGGATASHSKSSTLDIAQSFVWTPSDRVAVRGSAQYVSSRMSGQSIYVGSNQTSLLVDSVDVDLTGSLPQVSGLNKEGTIDPATAYLAQFGYHEPKNKGTMLAGNLDLEYKVSDSGFLRSITVGARAAKRTEIDNNAGTYWAPLGQSWMGHNFGDHPLDPNYGPGNIQYLTNPNVPKSDYEVATFKNFFGGRVGVPANLLVASQSLLQSYDWYHLLKTYNGESVTVGNVVYPNPTADQWWTARIDEGLNKTDSRITNTAAYIQARFASDGSGIIPPFSGNIGVRVFHDSLRASGLLRTPFANNLALSEADSTAYLAATKGAPGNTGVPGAPIPTIYVLAKQYSAQSRDYSYTRVLPSFNIKFDVSDKFIVRGAASLS
ncbi:MAG: TonB-dependent receptor plug domain-containing protein, partial [Novosphingobium sp.]